MGHYTTRAFERNFTLLRVLLRGVDLDCTWWALA